MGPRFLGDGCIKGLPLYTQAGLRVSGSERIMETHMEKELDNGNWWDNMLSYRQLHVKARLITDIIPQLRLYIGP